MYIFNAMEKKMNFVLHVKIQFVKYVMNHFKINMVDVLNLPEKWIIVNLIIKMVFVNSVIRNIILTKVDSAKTLIFQIVQKLIEIFKYVPFVLIQYWLEMVNVILKINVMIKIVKIVQQMLQDQKNVLNVKVDLLSKYKVILKYVFKNMIQIKIVII